ncbi:MAG: CPBP family intramembrane metalloprotease [Acidobacteriota bacterium]|nr:CPBP family intramembrane metalloprotease [Acidobacteriota bacterium]
MSEFDSPQDSWPPPEPTSPQPSAPLPEPPAPYHRRLLPDDVLTPWGWRQLLLFVIVALASLILLTNVMAYGAMLWLKIKPGDLKTFLMTNATVLSLRTALWYATMIAYLFVMIRLNRNLPFWRTIGWRDWRSKTMPRAALYALCAVGGMALAVVVEAGSIAFRTRAKLPIEALFHNRAGVLWLMAVGILLAPAVEETIFRGYLYPVLARTLGVEGGILATGFLFGLMHAPQVWGGWGQIGLLVLVGIVLTYARARTGTVLTSWLLHLGYNTFLFAGFVISTGGLRHLPPAH